MTKQQRPTPRWASISHAAKYWDCNPKTMRRYISAGIVPGHRVQGATALKVDLNELDDLMQPVPSAKRSA